MAYGLFGGQGLPPGLQGYVAGQQLKEQQGMNELAQIANVIGLRGQLQAQQQQGQIDPIKLKIAQLQLQQMQQPQAPETFKLKPGEQVFERGQSNPIFSVPSAPSAQYGPLMPIPGGRGALGQQDLNTGLFKSVVGQEPKPPSVSVTMPGETAYARTAGSEAAKSDKAEYDSALVASESLTKLQGVKDLLDKGDVITGLGADIKLNVQRARQLISDSKARGQQISDTQVLEAALGSDVFPMIKQLGIGARGLDTPAEREFLLRVMTGSKELDNETLQRMTQIRYDIAQRAIDRYNKRVQSGELDRFFREYGIQKQEMKGPSGGGWSARKL